MTQVFFYHGAADKLAAACALLGGAYAKRRPITVYAPEAPLAQALDRLLWSSNALSFIPHCDGRSPLAGETPIVLTDQLDQPTQTERLMNLGKVLPPGYQRFQNLVEVVGQDDADRLAARERVRRYKEAGCDVQYFDLSKR